MRYRFIEQHQGQFPISVLCRIMQVARCGYYALRKRAPSQRQQENDMLLTQIHQFFERSKQTYGSPRIRLDLKADGFPCGRHRVARIMRQAGMRAVAPAAFR